MSVALAERGHEERRPSWNSDGVKRAVSQPLPESLTSVSPLTPALSRLAARMLQETITGALPFTWDRRAEQLESCRPTSDDFTGRQNDDERDARLTVQAEACRNHARFLRAYPDAIFEMFREDVLTLMGEERIFLEREAPQVVRIGKALVRESQDVLDSLLEGVVPDGDRT